jgi:tRNA pseudouridine55 synthase
MTGILNIDKPAGTTSARVVGRVKRLLPKGTKIGHAGTLDPFATGVLLLLVGRATKWCEAMMDRPKSYETTVRLGANTATDDLESQAVPHPAVAPPPTIEQIETAVRKFVGPIVQMPPAFSALKVGGRRAYDLARDGKRVELKPRSVMVYRLTVVEYAWPHLKLSVDCGRGFYVRSLARELGDSLGVGGYLTALRRTRVGPFTVDNAIGVENISAENLSDSLHDAEGRELKTSDAGV